jgi:hypothetical protein
MCKRFGGDSPVTTHDTHVHKLPKLRLLNVTDDKNALMFFVLLTESEFQYVEIIIYCIATYT